MEINIMVLSIVIFKRHYNFLQYHYFRLPIVSTLQFTEKY